jgi:ketosteroid isomerase-like protein
VSNLDNLWDFDVDVLEVTGTVVDLDAGRVKLALLACSVVLGCSALGCSTGMRDAPPAPPTRDEILVAIDAYDSAWNRRDTATVAAALADDYVYFSSDGHALPRAETLGFLASPDYVLETAERSEVEVTHLTSGMAVVSSRWRGHGTWQGKPFTDDQRCSLVLGHSTGRWQLLAEHCTQIKPAS